MSVMLSLPCNGIHGRGLNLLPRHGALRRSQQPSLGLQYISRLKHGRRRCLTNQATEWWTMGRDACSTVMHAVMGDLPGATPPPSPNFPIWATWLLGSIISLILPIWKLKGGFLRKIGNKVEDVVEAVEDVVEIVEDVAEAVEKISSDVADSLTEDGVLKDAALWVEQASKEVAEDAQQTLDFIHKVEEVRDEVEEKWETFAESHADEEAAEKEKQSRKENEENQTQEVKESRERKEIEDRETKAVKEDEEEEDDNDKQGRKEKEETEKEKKAAGKT